MQASLGADFADGLAISTNGTLYATSGQIGGQPLLYDGGNTVLLTRRMLGLNGRQPSGAGRQRPVGLSVPDRSLNRVGTQPLPLASGAPLHSALGDLAFPPAARRCESCTFQNFQQGDGGYTADNTGGSVPGMWHYSTGRNADNLPDHSLPDSWYYGGGESATGGGNYSTWVASQGVLTSPPISLPASGTSIASFSYVLGTRNILDGDFAYVSVLPKNGSPITILSRTAGTLPQTNGDWQGAVADLSRFDGQTIQLQFTFNMVYANPPDPEGWYVDDVAIVNSVVPPPATISGQKSRTSMAAARTS